VPMNITFEKFFAENYLLIDEFGLFIYMNKIIVHIDMDAFFASIEQLDRPELKGKPVVVGGSPFQARTVVSSASYEARKFGIRSAMPTKMAYRLCPSAIFVHGRFQRYEQIFWIIAKIFLRYSPAVELASIDEAYIDLTGTERLFGDPIETARDIKRAVVAETGLSCSVGVAPNKLLAKIASDNCKPDGFLIIDPNEIDKFLLPKKVEILPGVGKKFVEKLNALGIYTVADVLKFPESSLTTIFGMAGGSIHRLARGLDDSAVESHYSRKSISVERTFETDIGDFDTINKKLIKIVDNLATKLIEERIVGRTVTIKLRYGDFSTHTSSQSFPAPTRSTRQILDCAISLYNKSEKKPLRLLGVSISNITPATATPTDLFNERDSKCEKLFETIVELKSKFGKTGIVRGFEVEKREK
jgi:DNA polymerase IV